MSYTHIRLFVIADNKLIFSNALLKFQAHVFNFVLFINKGIFLKKDCSSLVTMKTGIAKTLQADSHKEELKHQIKN